MGASVGLKVSEKKK